MQDTNVTFDNTEVNSTRKSLFNVYTKYEIY